MTHRPGAVAERLEQIRRRIHDACARCDRDPAGVTLVGISKRQPLTRVRDAIHAGLRVLGESRMQEAVAKIPELDVDVDWHFVGPLQSNKVKPAVHHFSTVHSVDRPKIAHRLDKYAGLGGRTLSGFVQVNVGAEPSKHGFEPEGLREALRPLAGLEHLRIVGLMAIPPYEEDRERARLWFRRLRELRDELCSLPEWSHCLGALSMGMGHDFEMAIEEGATHVRVGTSIFGRRPA